ncbi:MAG: universal stress protein [Kineosporiaceae bacterium]|jgi:nucleotide-binding universal stress UspA family protein
MEKILVGYEGGDDSRRALMRAVQLTLALGARLYVASVIPLTASAGRTAGAADPASDEGEHVRQLDAARQVLEEAGVEAEYLTGVGNPADALVRMADEVDADLVVVGTREPGAMARLLGQSVSSAVARYSHRDVLIVHRDPKT